MIEQFRQWYEKRHEYQMAYKERTGKKIVGCFCTYEPEELFYAADVLPVRLMGTHAIQNVTEPHIFGMFCPYCRDVLAQGLLGKYDYIDGITIGQSCLHLRQAYVSWEKHKNPGWSHYLPMPHHVQSEKALPYLLSEYRVMKKKLEDWIGRGITDDDLRRGIDIVNKARQVMKKIYEFRKMDDPPITGTECMYVAMSSVFTDKEEFVRAAEELLRLLPDRRLKRKTGRRIMLIGSEDDDIEYLKLIESLGESESVGCTVVIEEHCTTTRSFWDEVDAASPDPLAAIAARYIRRTPCPTKDWPRRKRFDAALKFARDWRADGAIIMQQKFCDPHEGDNPQLRGFLEENGVPTYFLEFDATLSAGPLAVRTEAFLETLERDENLF